MVGVGEPALEDVWVARGEAVVVIVGVDAVEVTDGVRITCNVNAAAVCTSLGGRTCSGGQLQARIARIRLAPASTDLKFWVIKIYSFLPSAELENLPLLFYHFQ